MALTVNSSPTVVWRLACKSLFERTMERIRAKIQEFEARVGVTMAEARKYAGKDRSGILCSYVDTRYSSCPGVPAPHRQYAPDANRLWYWVHGNYTYPAGPLKEYLQLFPGLIVKMKDGRVYYIMRSALPYTDPYQLTRLVYQLAKREDVELIDIPRGRSWESDATVIRTKNEVYTMAYAPGTAPKAPEMPALMLPQHYLRELEDYANTQIDFIRKQMMNLEYLWNVQARRLAARLKHQLEAELVNIKNKVAEYENTVKATLDQAKAAAQASQVTADYIKRLEEYVQNAKATLQQRAQQLRQLLDQFLRKMTEITQRTSELEAPPGPPPYRPDQWPGSGKTEGQTTSLVAANKTTLLILGAGAGLALLLAARR